MPVSLGKSLLPGLREAGGGVSREVFPSPPAGASGAGKGCWEMLLERGGRSPAGGSGGLLSGPPEMKTLCFPLSVLSLGRGGDFRLWGLKSESSQAKAPPDFPRLSPAGQQTAPNDTLKQRCEDSGGLELALAVSPSGVFTRGCGGALGWLTLHAAHSACCSGRAPGAGAAAQSATYPGRCSLLPVVPPRQDFFCLAALTLGDGRSLCHAGLLRYRVLGLGAPLQFQQHLQVLPRCLKRSKIVPSFLPLLLRPRAKSHPLCLFSSRPSSL